MPQTIYIFKRNLLKILCTQWKIIYSQTPGLKNETAKIF